MGAAAGLCVTGQHDAAEGLLKRARGLDPKDILVYLLFLENRLRAGDHAGADTHLDTLLKSFSLDYIIERLSSPSKDPREVPIARQLVANALAGRLEREALGLEFSNQKPQE
jgi:hypothetical protein